MTVAEGGGIFVSYRRQETSHLAGRLYDRLAGRFGEGQVFIDVDAIEPGVDFARKIFRAVAACKVLLAIIGPTWLTVADERGHRRLDDPNDIVRLEVEAALARSVLVIPILVEGAASSWSPGRKSPWGRIHAGQIITVHVAAEVMTIDLGGDDTRVVRRTTTQPVRSIKAQQHRKAAHVS